jgi:TfoX/Sxy family transcriptional regulator of competence genes
MAFDENLDARVAVVALPWGAERKKMFGGTGYLISGNMMAGVHRERLVLRLSEEMGAAALQEPFTAPFDITGRPMKGWLMLDAEKLDDAALLVWLEKARAFAESLPPK